MKCGFNPVPTWPTCVKSNKKLFVSDHSLEDKVGHDTKNIMGKWSPVVKLLNKEGHSFFTDSFAVFMGSAAACF